MTVVTPIVASCTFNTNGTAPPPPPPPEPPPSPCADILGNWKIIATRTDGDCDKVKFKSTEYDVTLRRETAADISPEGGPPPAEPGAANRVVIVLPGFGGCPGDFDQPTCKLLANCDVTSEGKKVGSTGLEWKFDNGKLVGSEISRALPPLSDKSCTANYADEGSKL